MQLWELAAETPADPHQRPPKRLVWCPLSQIPLPRDVDDVGLLAELRDAVDGGAGAVGLLELFAERAIEEGSQRLAAGLLAELPDLEDGADVLREDEEGAF